MINSNLKDWHADCYLIIEFNLKPLIMKRILFLIACLVSVSTTAIATTNTTEANASLTTFVNGYGNSFIFVENGIEFAVFPDGQFDFYAQNFAPNINFGLRTNNVAFSFNTGFNYNPWVQYDSFGAVIQVENTPIFYDAWGRVAQIGNIIINYNGIGRVARIGGLNLFWNGNVFLRHTGFINRFNRFYVHRPWHRFYAFPPVNFCVVNARPYRQFYRPIRNVWYRPYRNNVRHFNNFGRRGNTIGIRANRDHYRRYAQTPRNQTERNIGRRVGERNLAIERSHRSRIESTNRSRRNTNGTVRDRNTNRRSDVATRTNTTRRNTVSNNRTDRSRNRTAVTNRSSRNERTNSISTRNVTRDRTSVSNRRKRNNTTSVTSNKSRQVRKANEPQVRQRSNVSRSRSATSVKQRSSSAKNSNRSGRSNTRRSRG